MKNCKKPASLILIMGACCWLLSAEPPTPQKQSHVSGYFSAFTEYKLFKHRENSLREDRKINEAMALHIRYERAEAVAPAQLDAPNTPVRWEEQTLTIVSFVMLAILLVSLVVLFHVFIQRTRSHRMLYDIEQMRSDFFTKITHEFRAPLTVILGLSRQLKETGELPPQASAAYLNAIERQGKNLLNLVNQLLDIAHLKTSPDAVEWKTGNLVAYTEMIAETFRLYAKEKGIELVFYSKEHTIETDFVPDYINKILQNLLANAIKYSKAGDKVFLVVETKPDNKKKARIRVIDQGEGIDKESLVHVFDLFYQAPQNKEYAGSGIGLTLTKQLVEILGGKISVESRKGENTAFTVELPIYRNEKQIYAYWLPDQKLAEFNPEEKTEKESEYEEASPGKKQGKDLRTTLLLVEDNKDVAFYITTLFPESRYRILYARNGEEGLSKANESIPDIVITDVVMPLKNGMEMCAEMRESPLLNHIPIIMLTAKGSDEDQVKGLKCGADAYIRKPFNAQELQVRVEKLIENRNLLRNKYHQAVLKENREAHNINMDFLQRVTDIIHREMKNQGFSSKKLAKELSMSISQLNKKLNAATGYPASSYILQIKIAQAKKILASQEKTISEVAVECGIYDVNYFARIFKKSTGVTPSQFQRLPR